MPKTSTTQLGESNPLSPLDQASRDLLRAITQRPDQNNVRQVEELARGVQDWDAFLAVAREHRVLPLAFSRLAEVPGTVPPAVMERLKAAYHRNVFHSVAKAAELIAILKAVDLARIPAMPFKGVVLGSTIYPELAARHAGDIDILIDLENLRRAAAILLNMGYDLKTPVREDGSPALLHSYEYHFERPADGMVVELRWRLELTQPRYRRDIGLQWVWPTRQTTRLAGVDIPNMA